MLLDPSPTPYFKIITKLKLTHHVEKEDAQAPHRQRFSPGIQVSTQFGY